MSWTRAELKSRAKKAFYKNYWICVLVSFILCCTGSSSNTISCNTSSSGSNYYNDYDDDYDYNDDYDYDDFEYNFNYTDAGTKLIQSGDLMVLANPATLSAYSSNAVLGAVSVVLIIIILIVGILGALLSVFVFNPVQVGGCHFFLENAVTDNAGIGGIIAGFKNNYKGAVLTMFLRQLYTALWTLLLIVPGIIKGYEYRMVPYILADHPEMSHQEVFALSKKMMDGEKMNAFVLDLSFIGWSLLSTLTCGLLAIFYVNPYVNATNAELYLTLKRNKCYDPYNTYNTYDSYTTYNSDHSNNPYSYS